jgi:hypothetical protein
MKIICYLFAAFLLLPLTVQARQAPLPIIPVGLDAYRMWEQWPLQRTGVRAYMRSTYDRNGGNESADASHFLFMKGEDHNVTLDVAGKGILYFFRANHWHGSPWHFITDSVDNIVQENGTADPVHAKKRFSHTAFLPEKAFPQPLAWTWAVTKGADLIWAPVAFERSLQLAYSRTRYGTGYYIYHLFADEERLSKPIHSWDSSQAPDKDVLDLLGRAGTDIAPRNIRKKSGQVRLNKPVVALARLTAAPAVVRALKIRLPIDKAQALERLRLRVSWDNAAHPSIDAPLCLFFGAGTLYNRDNREYLVKGFPINIRFNEAQQQVELACYYPMPFFRAASFELSGIPPGEDTEISYEIRYEPYKVPAAHSSYFHATYKDIPEPEAGHDLVYLDTDGVEGRREWSGSLVGTSFIFSHNAFLGTLEGDPRFFFDDSQSPQAYGTGTEEWGGGGDYWGGQNMTLPLAGHPCGAAKKSEAKNEKDGIESAYRFLLADLMPFGRRAVVRFEHGGENLSTEHYEGVTYWYGLPAPSLIKTDSIDIGKPSSEQEHAYVSPQVSAVEQISSRYEWGIDVFPAAPWGMDPAKLPDYMNKVGKEIYPAHTEDGRYTRGSSAFTVQLTADNTGVLLRRTLDYSYPNQKAAVYVTGADSSRWEYAGTWYLAGANTCMYSDPRGELERRQHTTQTSNRRFRDDEFMIPAALTKGRSAIRIKVQHIPVDQELFPGFPFPRQSAWSELKYDVYSYIVPQVKE